MMAIRWLALLALSACASHGPPREVRARIEAAATLTPCPPGTRAGTYLRERLIVVQCETSAEVIHGWKAAYRPNGRRAMFSEYRSGRPHGFTTAWHCVTRG